MATLFAIRYYLPVLLTLCIIGIGGFLYIMQNTPNSNDVGQVTVTPDAKVAAAYTHPISPGFRLYKSHLFGFEVIIPDELIGKEFDDGSAASTITFENATNEKGFQIFVIPYTEDHVTEAQFKKDLPSGIAREPVNITIDGVSALVFFSNHNGVEMREVWFIHNGFLFEISTYKELDTWLSAIMDTWRFR